MTESREPVPKPLRSTYPTASILRHEIWNRLHKDNEHFQAGVFGREGKGKSGTALSIAEIVDPDFSIDQVMFDPGQMLRRINAWKANDSTKGRMIVADEAGVGLGNRTWYEKDQIKFAQVLQLIRSENMGILFTVPRGIEMDSQVRGGRLHAQLLVKQKMEGDYVKVEYERIRVGRRIDNSNVWTPKPHMNVRGVKRRVKTLRIGPPSKEIWEPYEEKKNEYQAEQYEEAADEMQGKDEDNGSSKLKEIAMELADGNMEQVVTKHGNTGEPLINKDLIRAHYGVSHPDAAAVRGLLQQQFNTEQLQEFVS